MLGQSNTMELKSMIRTGLAAGLLVSGSLLAGCATEEVAAPTPPTTSQGTGGGVSPQSSGRVSPQPSVVIPSSGMAAQSGGVQATKLTSSSTENSWSVTARRSFVDRDKTVDDQGNADIARNVPSAETNGVTRPPEVINGQVARRYRTDPFDSLVKIVVASEIPAYVLALPTRLAAPYVPPVPKDAGDPLKTKGPLPRLQRRVAGVMFNGGIAAILETGDPTGDVRHDVILPGNKVPSGDPQAGELTVESMTMRSLVLRADDGRSIEVKLSGLAPSVADALRQQFSSGSVGGAGDTGMGAGMNGMGGSSGRGGRGNKSGGGGPGASL